MGKTEMDRDLQVRELSMDILLAVFKGEEYSHVLIKQVLDKYDDWESGQKAFLKTLTMGVLERKYALDYVINTYSSTPVSKMKPLIRVVLEMGVYQILYMHNVYDTRACNLSVELAKKRGFKNLSGFVNGVLRTVTREKERIAFPNAGEDPIKYLSINYSVPEWMAKLFIKQYGFDRCEGMLRESLKEAPVRIHVKSSLPDLEKSGLMEKWKADGVSVSPCSYLPDAYTIDFPDKSLKDLDGFSEGAFAVQDFSSQLVGFLAPVKAGDVIVDLCAAPGGKSMYVADRTDGTVLAFDVSEAKVAKIRENIERMHLKNIRTAVWDATIPNESLKEKADVLIADVPCSGLGVIGRKPDLKYRLKEQDLKDIVELQKRIVTASVQDVKPGGYLIYSTCTVNKGENEEMVRWMCENLPLEEAEFLNLPEELKGSLVSKGSLQLLAGEHESDGFFISIMKKA